MFSFVINYSSKNFSMKKLIYITSILLFLAGCGDKTVPSSKDTSLVEKNKEKPIVPYFSKIFIAVKDEDYNTITALLKLDQPNVNEDILSLASHYNKPELVKMVLDKGVDVNAKLTKNGDSNALFFFIHSNNTEIVKLLLSAGAIVKNDSGLLLTAVVRRNPDIVKMLLDEGVNPKWDSLSHSVTNGDKKIVELLLIKKVDIHAKSKSGCTILDNALVFDHKEIAELLRKAGAVTACNLDK